MSCFVLLGVGVVLELASDLMLVPVLMLVSGAGVGVGVDLGVGVGRWCWALAALVSVLVLELASVLPARDYGSWAVRQRSAMGTPPKLSPLWR